MRKGWEYKTLGEVCEIEYGTRVVQRKDGGTIYPVYGGGGETFKMDKFNRENCLVIARFAMSKCCTRYVSGKFFLNDSGLSVKSRDTLTQEYLNHCIISRNDIIYSLGKGAAQRNLDVKSFKDMIIPVPPIGVQEQIVAELDGVNELLTLKRQQLSDYDALAQSIFYELFGDPVSNEKGWEVKKLGEVCELKAGKNIKASELSQNRTDGMYPCFGGNGIRGYIAKKSHNGIFPIIGRQGALCGNVQLAKGDFYATEHAVVCTPSSGLNPIYLFFSLVGMKLGQYAKGVAQPGLAVSVIEPLSIPLPPLPLQQAFAERIDAIEAQKQQVKAAIADLETLLASRMQYWFD